MRNSNTISKTTQEPPQTGFSEKNTDPGHIDANKVDLSRPHSHPASLKEDKSLSQSVPRLLDKAKKILLSPPSFAPTTSPNVFITKDEVRHHLGKIKPGSKRFLESAFETVRNDAFNAFSHRLALQPQERFTLRTPLPDFSFFVRSGTVIPSHLESPTDKFINISRTVLEDDEAPRDNQAAQFIRHCISLLLNELDRPNSKNLIHNKAKAYHLSKARDGLSLIDSLLSHLDATANSLLDLHGSMRNLLLSHLKDSPEKEIPDYTHNYPFISPIVRSISMNIFSQFLSSGVVWIPMDLFYGTPFSEDESLHFTVIQIMKSESSLGATLSYFETNGLVDGDFLGGLKTRGEPKKFTVNLTEHLHVGLMDDFDAKEGVFNGATIEALIRPQTRISGNGSSIYNAVSQVLSVLSRLARPGSSQETFINPGDTTKDPQKGYSCNFMCLMEAIEYCRPISKIAVLMLRKKLLQESLSIISAAPNRFEGIESKFSSSLDRAVQFAIAGVQACTEQIRQHVE